MRCIRCDAGRVTFVLYVPKAWGGPVHERTGPFPYRFRMVILILTLPIKITTVISRRVRWLCISFLQVKAGGACPRRLFHFGANM